MRKMFILLLTFVFYLTAQAQTYHLNVNLKNGTKSSFPIQEIKKITFRGTTGDVKSGKYLQSIIKTFMLFQNYPNPFNPATTIEYQIPKSGNVEVTIFNIKGQLIKKLVDEFQLAGTYKTTWDGKDDKGKEVASGLYFYRVKFGNSIISKRMILMK